MGFHLGMGNYLEMIVHEEVCLFEQPLFLIFLLWHTVI